MHSSATFLGIVRQRLGLDCRRGDGDGGAKLQGYFEDMARGPEIIANSYPKLLGGYQVAELFAGWRGHNL